MDAAAIERIYEEIKDHLARAERHKQAREYEPMRAEAETAAALFRTMLKGAGDPLGMRDRIRVALLLLEYSEEECDSLLASRKGKKKKKKIDIKGKASGGSEHTKKKRPSTKGKHQKSRAVKRQSYGGEKGDGGRRYPRKQPADWKGPWPPPEEIERQHNEGSEFEQPESGTDEEGTD